MKKIAIMLAFAISIGFIVDVSAQQQKAPNFSLKSADGKTYQLSQLKGKVVIVNFWATWCGPCRREIPDFIEAYKKYKSQGLEIIGVSVDEDGWSKVKPFVTENKINYPVVLMDKKVVSDYGNFNAIPTTFVVDKNGDIVDTHTGVMTMSQLESKIQPLLKSKLAAKKGA
jgi:peroxiredoxin